MSFDHAHYPPAALVSLCDRVLPEREAWAVLDEVLPKVLPAGWYLSDTTIDGAHYRGPHGSSVIVSIARELDGRRWLHFSHARQGRVPTWDELVAAKEIFLGVERTALKIVPPRSKYVNINPNVLHLWSCVDGDVVPDFTQGTGSL